MAHDFNKEPHKMNEIEKAEKRRIPVFILIIVGIFLAALIFYMLADREPQPGQAPVDTTVPAVQQNQDNTATATDSSVVNTTNAVAKDTATATATDQ